MKQYIYVVADKITGIPIIVWEAEADVLNPVSNPDSTQYTIYEVVLVPDAINVTLNPTNRVTADILRTVYKIDLSSAALTAASTYCQQNNISVQSGIIPASLISQ